MPASTATLHAPITGLIQDISIAPLHDAARSDPPPAIPLIANERSIPEGQPQQHEVSGIQLPNNATIQTSVNKSSPVARALNRSARVLFREAQVD